LQSAVALANSALDPDTLLTVADLDRLWDEHGYTGRHDRSKAELDAVRAIRSRLRELLTADRDDAVTLVNTMLSEAGAVPQLVRHDPLDWHIHAVPSDAPLATRILVESAMAMVDVIRADEMSRLAVCADDTCEGVVLDLSRNRSRRFCSTTCGNRNAVAAYRARQR
jgi:predicted RNA-binding Zn ribbon-like protein